MACNLSSEKCGVGSCWADLKLLKTSRSADGIFGSIVGISEYALETQYLSDIMSLLVLASICMSWV